MKMGQGIYQKRQNIKFISGGENFHFTSMDQARKIEKVNLFT